MSTQITIIVLFYNQERYVDELLDNIRDANIRANLKVIIVDDHSMDNTHLFIEKWFDKNRKCSWKIIKNENNIGISASILRALEYVDTPWIKCHAGDDLFDLGGIDEFNSVSKMSDPKKTIIMSSVYLINEDSKIIGIRKNPPFFTFSKLFKDLGYYTNPLLSFSLLAAPEVYKSAIQSMYYRNIEDWPLLMFALKTGIEFKLVNRELVSYRVHDKSIISHTRSNTLAMTPHQAAYEREIIGILKENLSCAPTVSSRYGSYIQILAYRYRSTKANFFIKIMKLLNIKYIIFRVLCFLHNMKNYYFR